MPLHQPAIEKPTTSSAIPGNCPIRRRRNRSSLRAAHYAGKVRPAILLWALGVPIPLVLLFLLIRGCAG